MLLHRGLLLLELPRSGGELLRGTAAGNRHHLPLSPARLSPGWDVLSFTPLPRIPQGREVTQRPVSQASSARCGAVPREGVVIGEGGAAVRAWSPERAGPWRLGLQGRGPGGRGRPSLSGNTWPATAPAPPVRALPPLRLPPVSFFPRRDR